MPASSASGHVRAIEARQRKAAAKDEKRENERKRLEDAQWRDEVSEAKLAKKAEQDIKQQEKLQRKAELKALSEKEEAQFRSNKSEKERPEKLTRAQIQQKALLSIALKKKEESQESKVTDVFDIKNPNRWEAEEQRLAEEQGQEFILATCPQEFVDKMSGGVEGVDRFPTKRLRAAYCAYELEWLDILKRENPSLKRSQLKEKIWKQWQKAPENPLNQAAGP